VKNEAAVEDQPFAHACCNLVLGFVH